MSAREGQEVSEYERQYEDGSDPRILDIVYVPLSRTAPGRVADGELVDRPEFYWRKEGEYSRFGLADLASPVAPLWIDGYSTYSGQNDKIPIEAMESVSDSLRANPRRAARTCRFPTGEAFGNRKRRVQGRFTHAGVDYALWVTDPVYERTWLSKLDGVYEIRDCYATVSLGEPYRGSCYKLLAGIVEVDR